MTYNVFSGTLNLTQSINPSFDWSFVCCLLRFISVQQLKMFLLLFSSFRTKSLEWSWKSTGTDGNCDNVSSAREWWIYGTGCQHQLWRLPLWMCSKSDWTIGYHASGPLHILQATSYKNYVVSAVSNDVTRISYVVFFCARWQISWHSQLFPEPSFFLAVSMLAAERIVTSTSNVFVLSHQCL